MSLPTLEIEKCLVSSRWDDKLSRDDPVAAVARAVVEGRLKDVFSASVIRDLISATPSPDAGLADLLISPTTNTPTSSSTESKNAELLQLCLAAAALHAFVQANWTGPDLDFAPGDLCSTIPIAELDRRALQELAYGGEPAYHLAVHPFLLRLAQICLDSVSDALPTRAWWRLRTTLVHAQLLDEPAPPAEDLESGIQKLSGVIRGEPALLGWLRVEEGQLQQHLGQEKAARECFESAAGETGLVYELSGALGKRTKFQQNEVSQLVLLAESKLAIDDGAEVDAKANGVVATSSTAKDLPENLALNDDTLLEQTVYSASKEDPRTGSKLAHLAPDAQPALHPIDQCIVLGLCVAHLKAAPSHSLSPFSNAAGIEAPSGSSITTEEAKPYVARVISHPLNWSVHTAALLLRSRLEASRTRTVERATLQLQALVDQMRAADAVKDAPAAARLRYAYALPLPSRWALEREVGLRYLSLGVVRSALEIFERLELWEEVVQCHVALEKHAVATTVVRDLLEGRKGGGEEMDAARRAKLYCILGDLALAAQPSDIAAARTAYAEAQRLVGDRSSRALRSLGYLSFQLAARQEEDDAAAEGFREAAGYLRQAAAINPLVGKAWFILGCAYLRVEDWLGAREAFSACVRIDDTDPESWANLAAVYLRLRELPPADDEASTRKPPPPYPLLAFQALKQALRNAHSNWKIWANYMIVSVDVGQLSEAARALARVAEETSGQGIDADVLDRLVAAAAREGEVGAIEITATGDENSDVAVDRAYTSILTRTVRTLFDSALLPRLGGCPPATAARVHRAHARLCSAEARWLEAAESAAAEAARTGSTALNGATGTTNGSASDTSTSTTPAEKWDDARAAWLEAFRCIRDDPDTSFEERVAALEEVVEVLRNVGGSKWRLQARSLVRALIGRERDEHEGEAGWERLQALSEELKGGARADDE
ncbi:hypothetical protein BD626DRAFT_100801 [Schizophyllum amplum]|uniref:Uncharacterized protein n=1 Tax=Schizophyllum amplum TaxID=97359 RepID=A0A550CRP9_9AGAR|nr:hypothetical protein BD626DRAFT_100801 [Auriculariopsis ampla]